MTSQVRPMTWPTTNQAQRARYAVVATLYKQQLGEVIRARRKELGLTQRQLAERAHVEEPQTISRWERGARAPNDLDAVAAALETTADDLLSRLQPVGQRQRRSLQPNGGTQLDRIEHKLDRLLSLFSGDRDDAVRRIGRVEDELAGLADSTGRRRR